MEDSRAEECTNVRLGHSGVIRREEINGEGGAGLVNK